jgi:hypothetical protein
MPADDEETHIMELDLNEESTNEELAIIEPQEA